MTHAGRTRKAQTKPMEDERPRASNTTTVKIPRQCTRILLTFALASAFIVFISSSSLFRDKHAKHLRTQNSESSGEKHNNIDLSAWQIPAEDESDVEIPSPMPHESESNGIKGNLLPTATPDDGNSSDKSPSSTAESIGNRNPPVSEVLVPYVKSWDLDSSDSCEAFFGNGFVEKSLLYQSSNAALRNTSSGKVSCSYHPLTNAAYCIIENFIFHPNAVVMSRGGEPINSVRFRNEDDEFPSYHPGAFTVYEVPFHWTTAYTPHTDFIDPNSLTTQLLGDNNPVAQQYFNRLGMRDTYKRKLLETARVKSIATGDTNGRPNSNSISIPVINPQSVCSAIIREPVFFVTRVEYANLYHTSTDWYNLWSMAYILGHRMTDTPPSYDGIPASSLRHDYTQGPAFPIHLVLMDGHAYTPLEDGWTAMFASVTFAKHFSAATCFKYGAHAPFGYESPLSAGLAKSYRECRNVPHLQEFRRDFLRSFGVPHDRTSACDLPAREVAFIRRENYLAHPRQQGPPEQRVSNEDEIAASLKSALEGVRDPPETVQWIVREVFSSKMALREQLLTLQDTCVLMGAHGAGLSHALFLPPVAGVFELQPKKFNRPHFSAYSTWRGLRYSTLLSDRLDIEFAQVLTLLRPMLNWLESAAKQFVKSS